MAPLRSLNLPFLTHPVLQFLAANGILSVEDFLAHDLYTLAAQTEHQTNSEVLKQICLRATSHIAYHTQATVMYLDTCNSFSSKRIAQFLNVLAKSSIKSKDQQGNIERVMRGIFHYNVYDVYSMLDLLHQIESSMHTQGKYERARLRLLVVDSISSVITPILSGSNLQGHSLMISLGVVLKKLALEYSVAVLITNHIVVDKAGMSKPALGESWKSMPHVRLLLSRDPISNICEISLIKHTSMVCGQQVCLSLKS